MELALVGSGASEKSSSGKRKQVVGVNGALARLEATQLDIAEVIASGWVVSRWMAVGLVEAVSGVSSAGLMG
jgi:hypothetical protein